MTWKLQCLVWITLISTSTSRCSKHDVQTLPPYTHHSPDLHGDQTRPESRDLARPVHSTESRDLARQVHSTESRDLERPVQRMSERSIPLHSGIQRVQDYERRRLGSKVVNTPILGNSHKVVTASFASRSGQVEGDAVVFPEPSSRSSFLPKVPEECLRTGICEDVPGYPELQIANIIDGLGDAREKYKVDELDTPEIAQRIGPPEETELCDFQMKVVIPQAAPDKDGNWHYILNQKNRPLQGFHVEICREDKSPCTNLVHFYSGYEASCKQKYVLRFMAGLSENGTVVEKPFKLPSCCSCVVRQKD